MKRIVLPGLFAAALLAAVPSFAEPNYGPAPSVQPGAKPAAGAKGADAKGAKDKDEPKIAGQTIERTGGGYLGLELVSGTFKLSFYDDKKKQIPADRAMAIARWLVKYNKSGDERALLNLSSDGKSLVGSKNVRAPYSFKLYLTIFKDASENAPAVENYIIDFSA